MSEDYQKTIACMTNARDNNDDYCGPTQYNGETISCEWDYQSNDCVHKDSGKHKLPGACFRYNINCDINDLEDCNSSMIISGSNCNDMLKHFENTTKNSDIDPEIEMNQLLSECVMNKNYICSDNKGNVFPNPYNEKEIDKFLKNLQKNSNSNINKTKLMSIMMQKINSQQEKDEDKKDEDKKDEDKKDEDKKDKKDKKDKDKKDKKDKDKKDKKDSSISKKISKKDLLLIIGGSALGLIIIILIILLIIKSHSTGKKSKK